VNFEIDWAVPVLWAQLYYAPSRIPWIPWILWLALGFFGIFPGIVAYMVWAERKVAARFQDRIGPNRVGPLGLLQPIADAIKLITKENIVPRTADQFVHILSPVVMLVSAFLVLAVIPFGVGNQVGTRFTGLVPIDPPAGLIYLLAASSMTSIGVFLAGWSSRNKYSLLGGMRAVAQLISYEIPQVLATIPIVLWTGSLSLVAIMNRQLEYGWFVFSPPGFLSFVIMTIASIAEVNRTPFDLPEAESEIIAGYHTEYSGMRFGLFFLAEYLSVFGVSCVGTVLYLGGGTLPFTSFPFSMIGTSTWVAYIICNVISVSIFSAKVLGFVFLMFWIRVTLPRMRVDRMMNFAWKYLIPLAIIDILIAALWYELYFRPPAHDYWTFWFFTVNVHALWGWMWTLPMVVVAVLAVNGINQGGVKSIPEIMATPARQAVLRRTITAR
jgi:NADH-quinone oxidoreductase subunit H